MARRGISAEGGNNWVKAACSLACSTRRCDCEFPWKLVDGLDCRSHTLLLEMVADVSPCQAGDVGEGCGLTHLPQSPAWPLCVTPAHHSGLDLRQIFLSRIKMATCLQTAALLPAGERQSNRKRSAAAADRCSSSPGRSRRHVPSEDTLWHH